MYARLTRRERVFVEEYLVDQNAFRAAIAAGYDPVAAKTADRWVKASPVAAKPLSRRVTMSLQDAGISLAVEERLAEHARRARVTGERVIDELTKIAFSNLADFITEDDDKNPVISLAGKTRDEMATLQEIMTETKTVTDDAGRTTTTTKVRIKLWDKKGALTELGRHFGVLEPEKDLGEMFEFTLNIGDRVVTTSDVKTIGSTQAPDLEI